MLNIVPGELEAGDDKILGGVGRVFLQVCVKGKIRDNS
jgi:hypothetical protein